MQKIQDRRSQIRRLSALIILLTPLFLQKCGQARGPAESSADIVQGYSPTLDHPAASSAVALIDKGSLEHFCSGTLIAADLIVTAAHCVFDKRPEEFAVMFGRQTQYPLSIYRDVVAKETYKKFQKFESNFDIAWVRFKGPLPAGFKPIEIWHDSSVLAAHLPLSLAGYGRTATSCPEGDLACQGGWLLAVDTVVREYINKARLFNLIVIGPRPGHGPCFGDSGGPAYMFRGGRWYLVGNFVGWDRILVAEQLETYVIRVRPSITMLVILLNGSKRVLVQNLSLTRI